MANGNFAPVLKLSGRPRPEAVLIDGLKVKSTEWTYYIEWRNEEGERTRKPVDAAPQEPLLHAWLPPREQTDI